MINRDHKSWGKWKIGVIENIFMGKDNIIRSIRTCTGKNIIERPVQLLDLMELYCDSKSNTSNSQNDKTFNVNAEEFQPNCRQ